MAGASQGVLRDTAWYSNECHPALNLFGNADTRIWLHASKSDAKKLLFFSPGTDIGMTATAVNLISREVMLQINPSGSQLQPVLSLHGLADAVTQDPEMCNILKTALPRYGHSMCVTGCDFTSFSPKQARLSSRVHC